MNNKTLNLFTYCLIAFSLILSGCGSSTPEQVPETVELISCETSDNDPQNDACGKVLLGLTDADGDFLLYNVTVTGIELTRRDGTQVSLLPSPQMIDFATYVELTELVTAATIPAGVYTSGSISISYADADIQVEKNGEATAAQMVDDNGELLTEATLSLELDADNPLVVARARPALLEIDFNLSASHDVDLTTEPVTVTTEPFISAEVDPVMSKEFRIRGPLIRVSEDNSLFRIAVRPFHRRDGRFGGANVVVNDDTNFEINGETFTGSEGLSQMAQLEAGTATVTHGLFERNIDSFTAITVYAGSSVPGHDKDAARGVITAREGDRLQLHGVTLIRETGEVGFHPLITVNIADTTHVIKPRRVDEEVSINDLSVGQAVTVLGELQLEQGSDAVPEMDATNGGVKMRLTFASGHQVAQNASELTMNLQALHGRSPERYNFAGTGVDSSMDADPSNYQVSVTNLMVSAGNSGDPVRFNGFVTPFGSAPADFDAVTVVNYAESRSQLYVDWPMGEEVMAFGELTSESLTINIAQSEEPGIYKLIQGGIRTDLTSFDQLVRVEPKFERGVYAIRDNNSVKVFSNFADFATELQAEMDSGLQVDKLHAIGGFSHQTVSLQAIKVAVKLTPTDASN